MHVGRNWYLSFNYVNLREEYGLVLSSYEEKKPEPRILTIDIPGGHDIDVSEAVGAVGYGRGQHVFRFLLYGDTEAERKQKLHAIEQHVNGVYAVYWISWDWDYYWWGRGKVSVEHLTDTADLLTITIDRDAWRMSVFETIDVNSHPTGVAELRGSQYYRNVQAVNTQTVSIAIGSGAATSYAAGTNQLVSEIAGDEDITVTVGSSDWILYTVEGSEDLKVNTAKFSMSGTNAVINDTYTITSGDIAFALEPKQHTLIQYRRWDL